MSVMREVGHQPFTRGASLLVLLLWSVLTSVPAWSAEPAESTRPSVSKTDPHAIVFTARQAISTLKAAKSTQPPAVFGSRPTIVSVFALIWPASATATGTFRDAPSATPRPYSARAPPAV